MAKEHPILAVEQGRYDLTKVCPKCGSQFVKMQASPEGLDYTCGHCKNSWSSGSLSDYPVEKVGELYMQFISEMAETLISEGTPIEDVIKVINKRVVKDITGVDV
jgi:ribosomal protein L37AE/L43A